MATRASADANLNDWTCRGVCLACRLASVAIIRATLAVDTVVPFMCRKTRQEPEKKGATQR